MPTLQPLMIRWSPMWSGVRSASDQTLRKFRCFCLVRQPRQNDGELVAAEAG